MHVISCFCSCASMQSSSRRKCLPSNWKNRRWNVGYAGQCWVLPQTSVMRSLCSGSVKNKFYIQI